MRRLAVIVALALAGFVAAVLHFGEAAAAGCLAKPQPAPGWSARFADPVGTDEATHVLLVRRAGGPVSGARVCVSTRMSGMTGMAMSTDAMELGPGRYRVPLRFPMEGEWNATVLVTEPGGDRVTVPVTVHVGGGGMM